MPAWLVLSPWFVVACALLLAAVVLILDFRDGRKETEITTRIYLERGASLIQAFEATLQTGMGFRWTDEELQGVLDGLGTGPTFIMWPSPMNRVMFWRPVAPACRAPIFFPPRR